MAKKYVVKFSDVDKDDIATVGGKGANLGEMTHAGFPVPPGFIITAEAYKEFLIDGNLTHKIIDILHNLDVNDSKQLDRAAKSVQHIITRSPFPKSLALEIIRAYFSLEKGLVKHPFVAVRSSATAEDLPGASFAGQQATFLNVQGEANLIEKVKEAWASLFTARAIFYRATHKFNHMKVYIAVPVQKMIQSEASGVMFTIDPLNNDKTKLVIEAISGLGELIVQGEITPDHYVVDKKTEKILEKTVHTQEKVMKGNRVKKDVIKKQKLTDEQIHTLASLGKKLEQHYYFPQDVEWAIEKGRVYIVQTRPITTTGKIRSEINAALLKKDILLHGDPASPGIASGPVKILHSPKEIHKIVPGDILVAEMTNPDFVPAMRKCVAIITEKGGRTSHAAIVSRELGIPAVVGTEGALKTLLDNFVITVNGATGDIYKGAVQRTQNIEPSVQIHHEKIKTATKVYVNLAEPDRASLASKLNVDGVGLLRAEFMIAGIGVHPKKLIEDRKQKVFVNTLSTQLEFFCESFAPRPVVYRTTDFRTNEYRNLTGGKIYEPEEPNPMLGFRGAARYITNSDVFELELEAIRKVRNSYNNLWLMIPYVRTPEELLKVKKIVSAAGLSRSSSFKLWLMVEIPTNVIRLDDFIDVGIDGVSIGSNDLTMLILGTDRDNSEVAHDFSELDPSVLWAIERTIKTCSKRGVTSSICGQAPSDYPELVEKLVSWGITSISVNMDVAEHVRDVISNAEKKLIRKKL